MRKTATEKSDQCKWRKMKAIPPVILTKFIATGVVHWYRGILHCKNLEWCKWHGTRLCA